MTFQKFAEATIIGAEIARRDAFGLVKAAHRAVFDYEPKPGFLYVRSRMISSRCNDNHDEFPAEEIMKSWKTAIGKPAFVNHHNEDHRRMRGVIIDAALHKDVAPDGRPDIWIEALHEVDAQKFPKLAEGIISGRINRTSMGCDVGFSVCSACNNKASTPAEYCQHIPRMKGQILYKHAASGKREGEVIREICHKLSFFENSFLVEPPADPTAVITGIDSRGLNKAASLTKEAAPEGIRFRYESPEYNKSTDHKLVATLPGKNGDHEEAGHLTWDAHRGMISMVSTQHAHRGKGIASLLWRRAHEISANRGLTPPRHSDVKTPDGMGWSDAVDKQELPPFGGPGQQELFPVPEESATREGPEQPRGNTLREHLVSDHGFVGGHPSFQRMTDEEAERRHQEKHQAESPYSRPVWPHKHAAVTQLPSLRHLAALHQGEPFQIRPKGDKWLVVDGKGMTRGEHSTEQDAKVHQATLYSSLPQAGDVSGNRNPESTADTATEIVRARLGTLSTLANYQVPANCLNCGADMVKPRHAGDERAHQDSPVCSDCLDGEVIDPKEKPPSIYHQETDSGGRRMTRELIKDVGQGRGRHFGPEHMMPQSYSSLPSTLAYGETKAPAEVDTLRTESCPVCGETDSFDGDRCEVCHFLQPPSMFTDPDTGVAKQMDLKKEPFDQGMVGPNGEPLPDVDTQEEQQAMPGMPGTPEDQVADLFCPACGFSADTQAPMTNNDPSMVSGQQGLMEGDVCPECGNATMLSPNDVGEMGGDVPQEIAGDSDADAIPDDQEADVDKDGMPDDGEPDIDADGVPDDAEPDENADGIPDDAEEAPEGPEEVPGEEDADPAAVEDEEAPQKGRKDNSRRASWRGHERNKMTKPNQTAGASSELANLKRTVAVLQEQLSVAGRQLHYLANLAGVSGEFDALKREGAKKIADIMNPAQPIPDPPGGAPTETTQQAEAPKTFDDPRSPGLTPGSTDGVPAAMTASPLDPGVTLPTSPYTQLVDPTQPVAGTETHVPLDQTKIETDVHIGDPMVNANNPQGYGFPLTGPFAADGAASANTTTSPGMQRTMASIRLAKLRKSAGLVSGDVDELLLGSQIERTASLSDAMIAHEISTLDSVVKVASRPQVGRRPQGGPIPKTAGAERRAPSLAGGADLSSQASIASGFDADDASDLFVDSLS